MKKSEVKIGGFYNARVSQQHVVVQIIEAHPNGGWRGINTKTRRDVRIKTAARLHGEARNPDGRKLTRYTPPNSKARGFIVERENAPAMYFPGPGRITHVAATDEQHPVLWIIQRRLKELQQRRCNWGVPLDQVEACEADWARWAANDFAEFLRRIADELTWSPAVTPVQSEAEEADLFRRHNKGVGHA